MPPELSINLICSEMTFVVDLDWHSERFIADDALTAPSTALAYALRDCLEHVAHAVRDFVISS